MPQAEQKHFFERPYIRRKGLDMRIIVLFLLFLGSASFAQSPLYLNNLGGSSFDGGNGVVIGPNNEHFFTGTFTGTADLSPDASGGTVTSVGGQDIYFAKYTSSGQLVWGKSIGGVSDDEGIAMVPSNAGGLYLTGTYTSQADMDPGAGTTLVGVAGLNPNSEGTFFARYSADGNLIWARSLSGINASCFVKDMARDAAGNLYLTGWYTGPVDFDPSGSNLIIPYIGNNADAFVAKYDGNGDMLWAHQIGGTASTWTYSIDVNQGGEVLVGGFHMSGTCDLDPGPGVVEHTTATGVRSGWAVKLDTDGQYLWSADLAGDDFCAVNAVLFDDAGAAYLGGTFEGTYDLDPGAAELLSTSIGNSKDAFLIKLDGTAGTLVQAVPFQGAGDDEVSLMTLANDGSIYFSGEFWEDTDMDPGPNTVQPLGVLPVYFCRFSTEMDYLNHYGWYGFGSIFQRGMAMDAMGRMVSTGRFNETYDFTNGFNSFELTSVGSFDAFIVSMGDINVGIAHPTSVESSQAYPNPSFGRFHLTLPYSDMNVSVSDALGRVVHTSTNVGPSMIDISMHPPGTYLVRAWNDRFSAAHKIVLE